MVGIGKETAVDGTDTLKTGQVHWKLGNRFGESEDEKLMGFFVAVTLINAAGTPWDNHPDQRLLPPAQGAENTTTTETSISPPLPNNLQHRATPQHLAASSTLPPAPDSHCLDKCKGGGLRSLLRSASPTAHSCRCFILQAQRKALTKAQPNKPSFLSTFSAGAIPAT